MLPRGCRAAKRAACSILLVLGCIHAAAFGQSITVPAQFAYWTTYGPPGGSGNRPYMFASGDEACQFACQYDSRCRDFDRVTTNTWTGSPGICFGPFTHTVRSWKTGAPYWAYDSVQGQHCKLPVRQTDSLTPVTQPPYICGFSTGDPRQDTSWIQQYQWVGSGWICPLGGYNFNSTDKTCTLLYATAYPPPQRSPKCANPVLAGSGCKIETIALTTLPSGSRSIPIELRYASLHPRGGGQLVGHQSWFLDPLDRRLLVPANPTVVGAKVLALRSHGGFEEFTRTAAGTWVGIDTRVRLEGNGPWQLTDFDENTAETYDSRGRLAQFGYFDGSNFAVAYASPTSVRPTQIQSSTGVVVSFTHNTSGMEAIVLPDSRQVRFGYQTQTIPGIPSGEPYLQSVTFEDDTVKSFSYALGWVAPAVALSAVEITDRVPRFAVGRPPFGLGIALPNIVDYAIGGRSPFALDSVYDQVNNRYSRFEYDEKGRTTLSEHAGGVDRYSFSFPNYQQTLVTEPLGATTSFTFSTPPNGPSRLVGFSRSAPGLPSAMFGGYFDAYGNRTSLWKWHNPSRNDCFASDPLLGRETARVEGLPYGSTCPSGLASYLPQTGTDQRKTLTEWHPEWRVPTRIAEPKKITTIVYHGSGTNCAPGTVLVGGRAPAVICSISEQATSDERGAQGFAATPIGTPRTWNYTYTTYGRVLTATDPNNKTTTYTYYPDNHPEVGKRGNVASISNAANHLTQITDYHARGYPTRIVDANGLVTVATYDARMRLRTLTVGTEQTRLDYDPRGLLGTVTLPDAATLTYGYDAAHRLTSIADHKGNRVDYTLDPAGNRTAEQVRDVGGTLTLNIARVMNALSRVERITGGHQ